MILDLLSPAVIDIMEHGNYVYHRTALGIDVTSKTAWSRHAWIITPLTSMTINDLGLYYGTTTGVFFLTHAQIAVGGNVTSSAVLTFAAGTAVPILGSNIQGLDSADNRLIITTDTGASYLPDCTLTTVYTCTQANLSECAISGSKNKIVLVENEVVFAGDIPVAAWSLSDMFSYAGDFGLSYSDGTELHTGYSLSNKAASEIDLEGRGIGYAYFNGETYPINLWHMDGANTPITFPGSPLITAPFGFVSLVGNLFAVTGFSENLEVFELSGNTLVYKGTHSDGLFSRNVRINAAGTYIMRGRNGSISLCKYDGTLTYVAGYTHSINANPDLGWSVTNPDLFIAVGATSPYISCVERVGDTLVNRPGTTLPSSTQWALSCFVGNFVFIGIYNHGSILAQIYEVVGTSLVLRSIIPAIVVGVANLEIEQVHSVGDLVYMKFVHSKPLTYVVKIFADGSYQFVEAMSGPGQWTGLPPTWVNTNSSNNKAVSYSWNNTYLEAYDIDYTKKNISDYTVVNKIIAEDAIYIGTDNGIKIVSFAEKGITWTIGTIYKNITTLNGSNVKGLALTEGATANSGSLVYGTENQFSLLELAET